MVYVRTKALNKVKIQIILPGSTFAWVFLQYEMGYNEMIPKGILSIMALGMWK